MHNITLYGTLGCHLCGEAEAWLAHFYPQLSYMQIDIACDERLVEQYGIRIPVLAVGSIELDWPFNLEQFQDVMLNHARILESSSSAGQVQSSTRRVLKPIS